MTRLKNKFSLLFWIVLLSFCTLHSFGQTVQTRGMTVQVKNEQGHVVTVSLYKGSYALIIGNSAYSNGWRKLPGVLEDVTEIEKTLEKKGFEVITAQDLSRSEFRKVVEQFINTYGLSAENQLLIYFAGHGYTERVGRQDIGYIVMKDAPLPVKNIAGFRQSAVEMTEIESLAKRIKAKHALFVFDSCFSGYLTRNQMPKPSQSISDSVMQPVRQFITSGSADQEVPDKSIFRVMFQRGLQGEADYNNDKYVTGMELGFFLQQKVVEYTNNAQTPQFSKIRDIALDLGDSVFLVENIAQLKARSGYSACTTYFPLKPRIFDDASAINQALDELNKTITSNPNCLGAYISRATILSSKGKKEEALKDYTRIIELEPKGFIGYAMRGTAYLREFEENLKAQNDLATALENAAERYKDCERDGNCIEFFTLAQPISSMNGEALLNLKKYDLAIKQFDNAIVLSTRLNLDDARSLFLRGVSYYFSATNTSAEKEHASVIGDLESSVEDFNKAIALNPSSSHYYFQRGASHGVLATIKTNHETMLRAIRDMSKSIELDSTYVPAYEMRADFYEANGETAKANADRLKAEELKNPKSDSRQKSGRGEKLEEGRCTDSLRYYPVTQEVLNDSKAIRIALAEYDRFISSNPNCMQAYIARGGIYVKLGEPIKSIVDFTKAIQLGPESSMGYSMRGMAYHSMKAYDKAVVDLGTALSGCRRDEYCIKSSILNQMSLMRGQALSELGRYDEALTDLSEAAKVYDSNAELFFYRGMSYFRRICVPECSIEGFRSEKGKESITAALTDLNKAISLNPLDPRFYLQRAVVIASKGYGENNREFIVAGINDLTKCIEMEPDNDALYHVRGMYFTAIGETEKGNADKRKAEQIKREKND